ncbi:MAG: pantoate--beta-alanine ligase [Gammaproteobacteria bacterium]|nr:pantoate--beta-alanine ligase [Gammaproteobacteria bacterium]MCP4091108.1 pantoate--beta-alanine ligase [Gammaproteobacteria bacterium]MCP4277366.1 pantoate--beta-alanine ligase [Gammaproteobacteria bacterium]MCP4831573.1 pantoate--beta-alanine ligase [Gammaproteobacteria bacterium]MCP4927796.1 pantoate--beta-alanine ligase [Gammaproteobacteria bacterium]
MKRIDTAEELRALLAEWHPEGDRIALVPTMGNLHKGHLSLVELAKENAERVIVSVFVNPTQFAPDEDYERYPRTLDKDALRLSRAGADVLFAPAAEVIYPNGIAQATTVTVPDLSAELEGESRPGHFAGVTSVVCRLFNICHPNLAVFGQKDFQQYVILKRMVKDLHLPVQLIAGPTARDNNGLALSSRNGFLNKDQQINAAVIYQALCAVTTMLEDGDRDFTALEHSAAEQIAAAGLEPDYISVRDADDLSLPSEGSTHLVVLAAACCGTVRLIDNVVVELPV